MTHRLQQYQINVNNDIQNRRNQSQLKSLSSSSASDRQRINELESELNDIYGRYRSVNSDLDCAKITINNMYQQIARLRRVDIDEYYSILELIRETNAHVYSRMINNCNPRRYVHAIDGLDDALYAARKYLADNR